MDIVLVIGQKRWEHRVPGVRGGRWQPILSFNVGNGRVVNLLDGVRGKAFFSAIPSTCTLESKFGVVDFVVDVLFKSVISAIHPSDVRVALHVNTNGRVEGVGVINRDTGVVDHNQVAVGACAGVFRVGAALSCVSGQPRCETWVVVHLSIWVKNGHVDFTGVVGGDVYHGFDEEGHLVGSGSRWEFVCLAAGISASEGITGAISRLSGDDAVGALDQVHEVGLDVSCTTVALAVQTNGNNAGEEAVVVGLLDGRFVIGLLRRVAVFGAFV